MNDLKNLTVSDINEDLVYDNIGKMYLIKDAEAREKFLEIQENLTDALATTLVSVFDSLDPVRNIAYKVNRASNGNKHASKGQAWGAIQRTDYVGGGLKFVSCSGHGGFLISDARNAGIPEQLRREDGMYEEDCDFMIIGLVYPENVSDLLNRWNPEVEDKYTPEKVRAMAAKSVANWHTTASRDLIQDFYNR